MAIRIVAAGNTLTPSYLTLLHKGYTVTRTVESYAERWTAKRDAPSGQDEYTAEDPLILLGLVAIGETRDEEWQANDDEIREFMETSPARSNSRAVVQ